VPVEIYRAHRHEGEKCEEKFSEGVEKIYKHEKKKNFSIIIKFHQPSKSTFARLSL
jgi:hypothetical protein